MRFARARGAIAFVAGACFLHAASLPARAQEYRILYEVQSRFQHITVLDTADGFRQLIFDGRLDGSDAIQSEMNLSSPNELTLPYSRHMMTALPAAAKLGRVLIVGLGGACMQRYLHELLPGTTIETVEIDPEIRYVAAEYFGFKEGDRQIVHVADGAAFMAESKDRYDVIFLDAFGATSIPGPLKTAEFFAAVKGRLAEGGVACANLWHWASDYSETVKTYEGVFPECYIVRCGSISGNSILLALPRKAGLTFKGWIEKTEAFEKEHPTGLDLPGMIERGAIR
jgi:spermidine synthase